METHTEKPIRRRRDLRTRRSVRWADRAAQAIITLGGIGTIASLALVCLFLIWTAVPLFLPATMPPDGDVAVSRSPVPAGDPLLVLDETRSVAAVLYPDGTLHTIVVRTGEVVAAKKLLEENVPVTWTPDPLTGRFVFAFAKSVIRQGELNFSSETLAMDAVPETVRTLRVGDSLPYGEGVIERLDDEQFRHVKVSSRLQDPVTLQADSNILLVDQVRSTEGRFLAALLEDGTLRVGKISSTKNLLTGKSTSKLTEGSLMVDPGDSNRRPVWLLLSGLGDNVFLVHRDGRVKRIDCRQIQRPEVAEEFDLIPEADRELTALAFLNGKTSLVAGDSVGRVQVWFRVRSESATTTDRSTMEVGHELCTDGGEVTRIFPSNRSRVVATAHLPTENAGSASAATVRLFHVTSSRRLASSAMADAASVAAVSLSPKDDGLFALAKSGTGTGAQLWRWDVHAEHPEVTLASLYLPVWYEGYNGPETVWQSSSGTDDFEPKFGLYPLIFGTLKATFYTMLFGVPIALLAAVYSSEFLDRRIKARVKPAIELMASLPSVVLGYFAGVILAPVVEGIIPHLLTALVSIPFVCLCGSYLLQLVPGSTWTTFARKYRLIGVALSIPLGIWSAAFLGRPVERWLFAGDIKLWLEQQVGDGTGAWLLLLLPASSVLVMALFIRFVNPVVRRFAGGWERVSFALLDLAKFLAGCLLALLLAYAVSSLLAAAGIDPRGTWVGAYAQRNALIVGFMMGFAVIPIIYTIADDALTAVPDSLRAGSLGAGATPWQTAVRVVIPTAMSGLFSAIMIGLGRAVGETMIVVMSTGNTPTKNINIFDGCRTLSANIATELPEAVTNGTHYRILFLTALNLFVITLTINTIAEVVRQRFRRRTYQL